MLKPAGQYILNLNNHMSNIGMDLNNLYYSDNYFNFETDDSKKIQFVSIDKYDNISMYCAVEIEKCCHFIHSLRVIRLNNDSKYDMMVAKDFMEFIRYMFFHYKFVKLKFSACTNSPYIKMYDKFCLKYGGRIVGIEKKDRRLINGFISDVKLYEVLQEDFIKKVGCKFSFKNKK